MWPPGDRHGWCSCTAEVSLASACCPVMCTYSVHTVCALTVRSAANLRKILQLHSKASELCLQRQIVYHISEPNFSVGKTNLQCIYDFNSFSPNRDLVDHSISVQTARRHIHQDRETHSSACCPFHRKGQNEIPICSTYLQCYAGTFVFMWATLLCLLTSTLGVGIFLVMIILENDIYNRHPSFIVEHGTFEM